VQFLTGKESTQKESPLDFARGYGEISALLIFQPITAS